MITPTDIANQRAVYRVANALNSRKKRIVVPPLGLAPDEKDEYVPGADLWVDGETIRVLNRRVEFEYLTDWPWDHVLVDQVERVDVLGVMDTYMVIGANPDMALSLYDAPTKKPEWTKELKSDGWCYVAPISLWLCHALKQSSASFTPEWRVWTRTQNTNAPRGVRWQARMQRLNPFDGASLAPLVNQARNEGYGVAMMPWAGSLSANKPWRE